MLALPGPGKETETSGAAVFHDSPVLVRTVRLTARPRLFHLLIVVAGTLPLASIALVQELAVSSEVGGTGMVMRNVRPTTDLRFEPSPGVQPDTLRLKMIISLLESPLLVSGGENFTLPLATVQVTLPFAGA